MIRGFGHTSDPGSRADQLQQAFQRVISNQRCQTFLAVNVPNHFCGEGIETPTNICNGDIGGGFTTILQGRNTLVGISSLIVRGCATIEPSGYTRVSQYRQWIRNVTSV